MCATERIRSILLKTGTVQTSSPALSLHTETDPTHLLRRRNGSACIARLDTTGADELRPYGDIAHTLWGGTEVKPKEPRNPLRPVLPKLVRGDDASRWKPMAYAPRPSARHLTFAMSLYPSPQARTNCTPALMRFADLATCKAHPQANRILERAAPLQQPQTAERHCFRSTRSMSCCCELISSLR